MKTTDHFQHLSSIKTLDLYCSDCQTEASISRSRSNQIRPTNQINLLIEISQSIISVDSRSVNLIISIFVVVKPSVSPFSPIIIIETVKLPSSCLTQLTDTLLTLTMFCLHDSVSPSFILSLTLVPVFRTNEFHYYLIVQ